MDRKRLIYLFLIIGSAIGSYLPALFGGDVFSFSSIIFGTLGGLFGIYLGYRLGE